VFHDGPEKYGRDGQIVRGVLGSIELFAEGLKSCGICIVAIHVTQQAAEFLERGRVQSAVFLNAVFGACTKLIIVPTRLGYADDGHVQMSSFGHRL
jgi:hypothetical protein